MLKAQTLLSRQATLRLLDELASDPVDFTLCIKTDTSAGEIEKELGSALDRGNIFDEIVEMAARSTTGSAVFYVRGNARVVWPPFPLSDTALVKGYEAGCLKKLLEGDPLLGLVIVRLGRYAVGLSRGEEIIAARAGTGLVHGRHHKGGSSSNRYARHREKQMEYFFTRVEQHSREVLEEYIKQIDYVFYGGARDTLLRLWRQCVFFRELQGRTVHRLLSLREPRRSTLQDAVSEAYSSRVFELTE